MEMSEAVTGMPVVSLATNAGMIQYCRVQSPGSSNSVEIYSLGVNASGAIAATNSGTITDCLPGATVILRGNATVYGGIVGENTGKVTSAALNAAGTSAYNLSYMPQIKSDKNGLTWWCSWLQYRCRIRHCGKQSVL